MRTRLIALAGALIVAIIAGQSTFFDANDADITASAKTACAVQGESCSLSSLDSAPASIISHTVLSGACSDATSDLHVMRYVPDDTTDGAPLVFTWCT